MKWIYTIAAIALLFITIVAFSLFRQPSSIVAVHASIDIKPALNTTFDEIIILDWNKNLLEIQKHFNGGQLDIDVKRNYLASYRIDVFLTDIKGLRVSVTAEPNVVGVIITQSLSSHVMA